MIVHKTLVGKSNGDRFVAHRPAFDGAAHYDIESDRVAAERGLR